MVKTKKLPPFNRLRELFYYDHKIGSLIWKNKKYKRNHLVGSISKAGNYSRVLIDGELYSTHRIVYKWFYDKEPLCIDHVDNNKLNNSIENLQSITQSMNLKKGFYKNKNGHRGITKLKNGKYQAQLKVGESVKYLGCYADKMDAVNVVTSVRRELLKNIRL